MFVGDCKDCCNVDGNYGLFLFYCIPYNHTDFTGITCALLRGRFGSVDVIKKNLTTHF